MPADSPSVWGSVVGAYRCSFLLGFVIIHLEALENHSRLITTMVTVWEVLSGWLAGMCTGGSVSKEFVKKKVKVTQGKHEKTTETSRKTKYLFMVQSILNWQLKANISLKSNSHAKVQIFNISGKKDFFSSFISLIFWLLCKWFRSARHVLQSVSTSMLIRSRQTARPNGPGSALHVL